MLDGHRLCVPEESQKVLRTAAAQGLGGCKAAALADPDCRGAAFDRTEKWRGVGGSPAAASISVLPACAAARERARRRREAAHAERAVLCARGRNQYAFYGDEAA